MKLCTQLHVFIVNVLPTCTLYTVVECFMRGFPWIHHSLYLLQFPQGIQYNLLFDPYTVQIDREYLLYCVLVDYVSMETGVNTIEYEVNVFYSLVVFSCLLVLHNRCFSGCLLTIRANYREIVQIPSVVRSAAGVTA